MQNTLDNLDNLPNDKFTNEPIWFSTVRDAWFTHLINETINKLPNAPVVYTNSLVYTEANLEDCNFHCRLKFSSHEFDAISVRVNALINGNFLELINLKFDSDGELYDYSHNSVNLEDIDAIIEHKMLFELFELWKSSKKLS
ncbi:hypothetical protein [Cohnella abietis]|uniref:Uncharacterized protein n=1 Tax=Cohnella abietis TaxID=2507935 RepID=A0A3T1CY63_9BACL|nr:hypothetical protein [Cohnella abietis]BBI30741.1 hypothetical protein KCTCHS21_01400 [Cohnella abietis]